MQDGGHLAGWLVDGDEADKLIERVEAFAQNSPDGLVFAVGDGNHSLATAKTCWENIKANLSDAEKELSDAKETYLEETVS